MGSACVLSRDRPQQCNATVPWLPGNMFSSSKPCQQIGQAVSRENDPPISNPAGANNISRRKHRSRCDHRAIHISTPRNPNPSPLTVSNLRCNLEALFAQVSVLVLWSSVSWLFAKPGQHPRIRALKCAVEVPRTQSSYCFCRLR
jgi:hypothetical protein